MGPGRATDAPKTRFYLQARNVGEAELIALQERLISEGAQRVNLFVPAMVIVCEAPKTLDVRALVGDARVDVLEESVLKRRAGKAQDGVQDLHFIRMCYEKGLDARVPEQAEPDLAEGGGFADVVRVVSPDVVERSKARARESRPAGVSGAPGEAWERNIQQNSEFLVGTVLVQLVFPESEGHSEDWTDRMIADATSGAYFAALDYQAKFPHAALHFTFKTEKRVPTLYEPITTTMDQHEWWIKENMWYLKIPTDDSAELMVHEYNNIWREYYRTNWVFTAFIVNAANDGDHCFPDPFYTAYAMLGGPYLVMPCPAGSNLYKIDPWVLFSTVFQHEMARVFWAVDEFPEDINRYDCDTHTGYLDYYNGNKVNDDLPGVYAACHGVARPCIMWRFEVDEGRPVCSYTQGQIGVIDDDDNGVPDVFDAAPIVDFEGADEETVVTSEVAVRMKVISRPVPNQNPFQEPEDRVSYAAALRDAKLSVGALGWSYYLNPVDGVWDEVEEDIELTVSGIASGLSRVGVVARNVFGKASPEYYKSFYYLGITFALFSATPDNDGSRNTIRLSWKTVGDTFGADFDLYRVDESSAVPDTTYLATFHECVPEPGGMFRCYEFLDADVSAGYRYKYFVTGYFDFERDGVKTHYEVTSEPFLAQSMYPIYAGQFTSQACPNPFRDRTQVSVRVPETREEAGGGGSSGSSQLVRTPVTVTVFDVKGRLVKRVYNGELYAGVKTFEWDGTNEGNGPVRSGVYFVQTIAGRGTDVKKIVVVR
jgi:hypothetical protein